MSNFYVVLAYEARHWPFRWGPFGGQRHLVLRSDDLRIDVLQLDRGELSAVPVTLRCKEELGRLVTTAKYRDTRWTPQVTSR